MADSRDSDVFSIDEQRHRLHVLHIEALQLVLANVDDIDIILLHNRKQEVYGAAILCNRGNRADVVWLPDLDIASLIGSNSGRSGKEAFSERDQTRYLARVVTDLMRELHTLVIDIVNLGEEPRLDDVFTSLLVGDWGLRRSSGDQKLFQVLTRLDDDAWDAPALRRVGDR